jgi:hypothetical protein
LQSVGAHFGFGDVNAMQHSSCVHVVVWHGVCLLLRVKPGAGVVGQMAGWHDGFAGTITR